MKGYRISGLLTNGEPVNVAAPDFAEMHQEPGLLTFQYEFEGEKVTRTFRLEHFAFLQITENTEIGEE